jgi:hypothetical protein
MINKFLMRPTDDVVRNHQHFKIAAQLENHMRTACALLACGANVETATDAFYVSANLRDCVRPALIDFERFGKDCATVEQLRSFINFEPEKEDVLKGSIDITVHLISSSEDNDYAPVNRWSILLSYEGTIYKIGIGEPMRVRTDYNYMQSVRTAQARSPFQRPSQS